MTGTVCTLFELQHGDDTKNEGRSISKTSYSSRLFLSQIMCQLCRRDCSFIILTSDQAVRYNETHAVNIEIFIKT